MIVVDTNVIACLCIPGFFSPQSEHGAFQKEYFLRHV